MPHLLIAGSTGSGKSVAINAFIMSILYKATPDQVRLILVDPKRLELGNYEGVPHLYTPIITEPKLAANALRNAVREMERRLKLLAAKGVRNIDQYNRLFENGTPSLFEEESDDKPIPYIVINHRRIGRSDDASIHRNVEESITRLAQMARAVGIHLVLATQRPSVDVITGLIKATSRHEFRFVWQLRWIREPFWTPTAPRRCWARATCCTCLQDRRECIGCTRRWSRKRKSQPWLNSGSNKGRRSINNNSSKLLRTNAEAGSSAEAGEGSGGGEDDPLYQDAVKLVVEFGKASTSLLQRRLRIGYGRAAHLIDLMEQDGIVGAADGPKPREVLKRPDWISEIEETMR